jgi:hypothetical protein
MRQFIVVSFVLFSLSNAFAANGNPPAAASGDNAQLACVAENEKPMALSALEFGKFVTVQVPADKYAKFFVKHDDGQLPTPVLYINGFGLKGLSGSPTGCRGFSFLLQRTNDSRDIWGIELSRIDGTDNVPVGIGTVQSGFIAEVGTARLMLTGQVSMALWWVLMAVLLVAIFWMGATSGLLRDLPMRPAPGAADQAPLTALQRPFSLARVQMAFWFTLAMGAYVYIWIKTGDIANIIPDSVVTLMGISAGTTVLSAVVDTNGPSQPPIPSSGSFIKDILMDHESISFHRFQMLMWTIVLGFVFVKKVTGTWIMPDFDAQLLGLMGVGSATYLGFKIPAAQAAANAPSTQAPAGSDQHPPAVG